MLRNKKKTLRKIMSEKNRCRNVPVFLWENSGLIIVCITIICGREAIITIKIRYLKIYLKDMKLFLIIPHLISVKQNNKASFE
jgi:hypothetical protein